MANAYVKQTKYLLAIQNSKTALGYGTKNEKAIRLASLANLYQYKLKDQKNGLKYYKLYLPYLQKYVDKKKAAGQLSDNEIGGVSRQLKIH